MNQSKVLTEREILIYQLIKSKEIGVRALSRVTGLAPATIKRIVDKAERLL